MFNQIKSGYVAKSFLLLSRNFLGLSIILFSLFINISAQTMDLPVYDVQPGTKNNKINLTVANISEKNSLEDLKIKPVSFAKGIILFKTTDRLIKHINSKNEAEVEFEFDISRNALVNMRDTLKFTITGNNNVYAQKEIILNFTAPKEYRLEQNYPNPFNPTTKIQYQLSFNSKVTLKIYDILGEEVATLVNEVQDAGFKEISFIGSNYASGIYIYRITAQNNGNTFTGVKKMVLVK